VIEDGACVARPGSGRFVRRACFDPAFRASPDSLL
jgi:hypothetical protein